MKKLFYFFLILIAFGLSGCGKTIKESKLTIQQKEIYQLAVDVGYKGTFEEWLESIKGEQGIPGKSVELIVEDGYIKWKNTGDSIWYQLVPLQSLIGTKGTDGKEVTFQISDGYIKWQYKDEITWTNLISLETLTGAKGEQGEAGVDGKKVTFQVADEFIQWQYTGEFTWTNLISLETLTGKTGIGIKNTYLNNQNELIIVYTDDSEVNIGKLATIYTVVFKDYNGYILDVQTLTYGSSAVVPTDPIREGYTFIGWDGSFEDVRANIILTAIYSPLQYSIVFDSNGGSPCEALVEIEHGNSVTLPNPVKTGYVFLGWYEGNSINSRQFFDSDPVTKNVSLVARWALATHVICFEDEKGVLLLSENVPHGSSAYLPDNPTIEGYTFIGWDYDLTVVTEDVIVRPLFSPNNYTINFNSNGGTSISSLTLAYLAELPDFSEPTRTGYSFMGWYSDSALTTPFSEDLMPLGGMTVYAKWQILSYTLTYDTQGGKKILPQTLNYNSTLTPPEDPFREFYNFVGWSTSQDVYVSFNFTTMPDYNLTIYAIWKVANLQFVLLESGTYAIIGVNPTAIDIEVPSIYKEIPVTHILAGAFKNGALVESLTIADSINSIEPTALSGLSALKQLTIPFIGINREAVGYDATLGILFGTEVFPGSYLITHYFPDLLRQSYSVPSSLVKLTVTDATILKVGSLSGLNKLQEVIISDSVETIEEGTFALSLSLKSMQLPFIGISLTATGYDGVFGAIFGKSNYGVVTTAYKQGTYNYYLPNALESLQINDGTYIGDYALMNLRKLREVSLPMTIETIGNQAFYNDITLASIVFPDNLRTIGSNGFSYDPNILPTLNPALNSVVLPAALREVGTHVFGYTNYNPFLKIYSPVSPTTIYSCWKTLDSEYEVIYNTEENGVINGLNYVLVYGQGVTIIGVHFGNKDSKIVIPSYVDQYNSRSAIRTIASGAFVNNPYLEELCIGANIYYVGGSSVAGTNLTVYLELPYIPQSWVDSAWNPTNVTVVLNATTPEE